MEAKERVAQIQHEVAELHPLLHELFRKIEELEQVYYTHGNSEMGADFILYRRDGVLRQTHCIGVVAKLGAIRQDHSDVLRQIEECSVPRTSPEGRGEIILTETWVISTGEITTNARDKIAEKFRGRKVEFIPGQRLIQLIELYLPDAASIIPIELQTYRNAELDVLDRQDARTALIPGATNEYVCPDVNRMRLDSTNELVVGETYSKMEDIVTQVLKHNFVLVESTMGGGKSRFLRELCRHLLKSDLFTEGKVICTYISCTDLSSQYDLDIDRLVEKVIPAMKRDMVSPVVVVLDGLDELKLPPDARASALLKFIGWASSNGERRLVLSTRPIDAREVLGPRLQNVCLLRLELLRGKKAIDFFQTICGNLVITTKIIKDLSNSGLIRAFEATPIAYTLLARVMNENDQEVPASIPELFAKYFELTLGRWEIDKGLIKQFEFQAMQACLSQIAVALLDSGRAEMPRTEAMHIVDTYLSIRPRKISSEDLLRIMHERTLVLFLDESVDTIGFRHKSFAEFFYAMDLAKKNEVRIRDDAFLPFWIGVYYFYAGIQKDCTGLAEALLAVPMESAPRLLRVLNFGNILQAAYMTPNKLVSDTLQSVLREAAELFLDCKAGRGGVELSKFSVMQLLSLFRMVVSDTYGYAYFKASLEDVICDLATGEPNECDALILFFACIAHAEADGKLDFDSLIKRHGDALPLELKFAIKHESKKFLSATQLVKRMQKRLLVNMSSRLKGGVNDVVKRLYYTPIRPVSSNNSGTLLENE